MTTTHPDDLLGDLCDQLQREVLDAASQTLRDGAPLADNLAAVLHAAIDVLSPFRDVAGESLAETLRRPEHGDPERSAATRMALTTLMTSVVGMSRPRPPAGLRGRLPDLLRMHLLGVIAHWAVDPTDQRERTRRLVDDSAALVSRCIAFSRLPVARGLVEEVLALALLVDGG